jgi:hypothetical protein
MNIPIATPESSAPSSEVDESLSMANAALFDGETIVEAK